MGQGNRARGRPRSAEGVVSLPLTWLESEEKVITDPGDPAELGHRRIVGCGAPETLARTTLCIGDPDLDLVSLTENRLDQSGWISRLRREGLEAVARVSTGRVRTRLEAKGPARCPDEGYLRTISRPGRTLVVIHPRR